ncbi:asparagine synthase (glutamine-hydrolyzing) [Campylobacter curvus]|uniref:asparagine synthase (glutamine-hydrolyzing) n=1 Tax=Campylobacter curvus TaxID=200 RepID=UPI0014707C5C|nr:asparagine synthase (glutamine-hydrolyzing) [Campylobacter curvus]
MCGIVGIWSNDNANIREKYVKKILDKQYHRGPDNTDMISINNIILGHNRLAIIDLSQNANQPFTSNCGRYTIVFNGEIYNYLEIKSELEYDFQTSSDTEILLASYMKYGIDCLKKLNGMFAFAIYDRLENTLFCARDRIGKKPFVYSEYENGFYFASELAALFSIGIFSDEPDDIGAVYSNLRNFRHIPEPYTRYKIIRRLEPAHAMMIKDKKIVKKWCYWSPGMQYDNSIKVDDVYDIVCSAIKLRQRADVEIGILLSGGVDSSAVAAVMSKNGLKPRAFTLRGDDEELQRAKLVASKFDLELNIFEYNRSTAKELYAKMIEIYGEEVRLLPLVHAARLYEQISKCGIKVVMSGIGADEIFYGYDGIDRQLLFSDMIKLIEILPNKILKIFEKIFQRNSELKLLFELAQKQNLLRKGYLYRKEAIQKGFKNFDYSNLIDFWANKVKTNNYIDVSSWIGLISENAHSITISGDLPSMMYSIETRAPFLDFRVIEMAFKIDAHKKVSKKANKLILKQAFERLLPYEILYAKKKGFGYGLQTNTNEEYNFFNK